MKAPAKPPTTDVKPVDKNKSATASTKTIPTTPSSKNLNTASKIPPTGSNVKSGAKTT